jgi:hypothetical protein
MNKISLSVTVISVDNKKSPESSVKKWDFSLASLVVKTDTPFTCEIVLPDAQRDLKAGDYTMDVVVSKDYKGRLALAIQGFSPVKMIKAA